MLQALMQINTTADDPFHIWPPRNRRSHGRDAYAARLKEVSMGAFARFVATALTILLLVAIAPARDASAMEYGVNRPGGDFMNFALPGDNPGLCQAACNVNPLCKAWTFVKSGVQGPQARCWLKSTVPSPIADACCVSGVRVAAGGGKIEPNTDRPGGDYTNVTLPAGSKASACRKLCNADPTCKAWTYAKAGVQAPNPRCWLKNTVPPKVASPCCTSGVK